MLKTKRSATDKLPINILVTFPDGMKKITVTRTRMLPEDRKAGVSGDSLKPPKSAIVQNTAYYFSTKVQ